MKTDRSGSEYASIATEYASIATERMQQGTLSAWTSQPKPRLHFCMANGAAWFSSTPSGVFITDANVRRHGHQITLQLWRCDTEEDVQPFVPVERVVDRSLLASMLQKAVRRQLPDVAASVALELAHCDPLVFPLLPLRMSQRIAISF